VLTAVSARIRQDAADRGIDRTVVLAHAFITGARPTDSERDIRVGGVADVPAGVFDGFSYAALGHLHGQQQVSPVARYSGSPLAFSFGEKNHAKSVTLVELDGAGQVTVTKLATPVPRPLREVRGRLDELLARPDDDLAEAWVKAVLTDPVRPAAPMERLREKWPHTLVLDFDPEGGLPGAGADLARLAAATDPIEICGLFVEFASGGPADDAQQAVLRAAVETAQHAEAAV
jgi:exonuclease SbcD